MDGSRNVLIPALSVLTVILGGCHTTDTGHAALDDYVKKECAMIVDFKDRMGLLTHDFATHIQDQAALADTVLDVANLYDELIAKAAELGDPPNGEGTGDGDQIEQATRSLIADLHTVAVEIRTATEDDEVQAAIGRMNNAIVKSSTVAVNWQKNHPMPEVDRLKKAYPGCSDQPE